MPGIDELIPNALQIRKEAALEEARKAEEYVRLAAAAEAEKRALIERLSKPSGKSEEHCFNPFWARFSVNRHSEIGITRMAVTSRYETVAIGGFLNPDDRESFATAFSRALAAAKGR